MLTVSDRIQIIDAHSKWMDIHCVNSTTSSVTIDKMRSIFSSHGLPEIIVSDNGSNFVSSEFKSSLQKNDIKHITSAPYHPSTNGLVERAVQTLKQGMKKQGDGSVETKLARFLLSFRITPQSTTGESPAQLRWGRSLKSHLDLLRPDVAFIYLLYFIFFVIILFVIIFQKPCLKKDNKGCMYRWMYIIIIT